jgi:hypothetical protein
VNTKDDRTDVFGIPYKPLERDEAIAQYQRRSMHKLHVAEWQRAEFERLEGELTTADFFDFDTERFLPAQAHADGRSSSSRRGSMRSPARSRITTAWRIRTGRPCGRRNGSPSGRDRAIAVAGRDVEHVVLR